MRLTKEQLVKRILYEELQGYGNHKDRTLMHYVSLAPYKRLREDYDQFYADLGLEEEEWEEREKIVGERFPGIYNMTRKRSLRERITAWRSKLRRSR